MEAKIRALRKERNKARLHPTKEQGPKCKRRKINEKEYVNIKEIWGEPKQGIAEKRKKEKDTNVVDELVENKNKKIGKEMKESATETELVEQEQDEHITEIDRDWEKKFKEYRQEILREQEERKNKLGLSCAKLRMVKLSLKICLKLISSS